MTDSDLPPDFRDAVAELLHRSQWVEWTLRVLLSDMNEVADIALRPQGIRFKSRRRHFENHTLGRLVGLFALHSDDDSLVARLRSFTRHRNDAAHAYFIVGWFNRENAEVMAKGLADVRKHTEEAAMLERLLSDEAVRINTAKRDVASLPPTP